MALVATAKNLAVSQNRATKNSSKARLWVYDRRLELLTRAFTFFGGTCACRIASQARVPILDCGAAMPGVRSIRRVAIPDATCITGTPRSAALLTLGGSPLSGALERTVALIAGAVPGSAESDAGPIEGAAPRTWWIDIPPPPGASRAEQWISEHALMDP
jgi:hypothetical protein